MNNNVKKCLEHRYRYYVLNEPIISDYEYDILEKEAKKKLIKILIKALEQIGELKLKEYNL